MGKCSSENFVVPVLHIQIGIGNDVLNNFLDFIDSDVEKLSTGTEVVRNTLVTLNQVIAKIQQNCQIWDVNDGVMLQRKYMHLNWLQVTKYSTPGLNYDILITISLDEKFLKKKKEERKKIGIRDLPIINQEMHVD